MKFIENAFYYIVYGCWYALSRLPLWVHYRFSDLFAFLACFVIRYRRKTVRRNLVESFPEKSLKEIRQIEWKFYRHVCDLFMESLKNFSISEKEFRRRMVFTNVELLRDSAIRGKNIGLYLGHYCNWEWMCCMPLVVGDVCQASQFYHALENSVLDRLFCYARARWGGVNISSAESIRGVMRLKNESKLPIGVGFNADQVPMWNSIHYWTPFLNHPETPVFTGAERLMKKLDMDVYYAEMRKVKRGYYEVTFLPITKQAKQEPDHWITEQYTRMLEKTILKEPAYWLWSHRRWKRTKEEYNRICAAEGYRQPA